MDTESRRHALRNLTKSKFVRSIFLRVVLIFSVVIVAIIAIVFFSFSSEIQKSIISERQQQLDVIEDTLSKRMNEVSSIAYNISNDEEFYLGSVTNSKQTSYEKTSTLARYLVGNGFIECLAYYKFSDPKVIYTSQGELSYHDFWNTFLNYEGYTEEEYIAEIKVQPGTRIFSQASTSNRRAYFAYTYPLPQFSTDPQALIIMLIPVSQIKNILDTQLANCSGITAIYDASDRLLYQISNLEEEIPIESEKHKPGEVFSYNGKKYIELTTTSAENGWTYVSVLRINDIISEIATKQLIFILLLLLLMIIAILTVLAYIITQYKPINSLAMSITDAETSKGHKSRDIIDEKSLLSDTFATLKDDSEQKQKFETAYYEAEAASKAKSAFLSNMSHDIRTPMNAIVGMTEIALKHADDPGYVKECLQNVSTSSQYLLDIINNVLDMSRIESGKFALAEGVVDLPKMIHEIITILNHSLEVKSQNLIVEVDNITDEQVIGDHVRLTQVFMNILSNSVKFTKNGGNLSFRMNQRPCNDPAYGNYTFIFSDNGIGMSPEFVQKVFETFSRDDKLDVAKIEGTGLGMAIAKNFVELMGGTIQCESSLNQGTTFTVSLKMKLAETPNSVPVIKDYSNVSVLILGEEPRICNNQARLFRSFGVETACTSSIPATLKLLENTPSYQFVIINQMEDDINGTTVISQLSKYLDHSTTTYVLTARDMYSIKKSISLDAGYSAFLQRPLFPSMILSILNQTFDQSNLPDEVTIPDLTGMRVILAEDNKMNLKIAHTMIQETHAEIYDAYNGKEAVKLFKDHAAGYFNIILMDVQMPVMNGYEATSAIRSVQREDALTIPIYAMTANTFDEDVRQVREAGMNGHLGKPYVSAELYRILESAR